MMMTMSSNKDVDIYSFDIATRSMSNSIDVDESMSSSSSTGNKTSSDAVTSIGGVVVGSSSSADHGAGETELEGAGGGLLINIIILYYPPLIVLLGTIGNFLSLAVFRSTKLRQLSTSCYLTALSLSDTGCLLPYFATWLEILGVSVYNRPVCCQLLTYLFYVCGFMSPWFVVAFTVERFVATCYPLRRAAICTVSRAQAIVLALVFIALISYLYILFVAEIDESSSECDLKSDHLEMMNVLNFLDTIATLIVPGVLITGLNVLIARAVLQIEKVRCTMLPTTTTTITSTSTTTAAATMSQSSGHRSMASSDDDYEDDDDDDDDDENSAIPAGCKSSNSTASSTLAKQGKHSTTSTPTGGRNHLVSDFIAARRARGTTTAGGSGGSGGGGGGGGRAVRSCYQMKITKMLLLISTVFVVLNAPSYLVRLWVYFARSRSDSDNVVLYNLQQWSQLLFHLNFAINFLLYCVSGQNFRRSLKALFWRLLGRIEYGANRRIIGRSMSFNSSKRTMTIINNSVQGASGGGIVSGTAAAATNNNGNQHHHHHHPVPSPFLKAARQLSDETTVVVVVDSV